ncbi:MAG: DUF488 domain-containing protein [Rhodocyclaceae bacterium]|nr:DUF488 domain-containing protein [Rhodocyclaceae bacterium]
MILVKRVYDPADAGDGARFLVDRLWPRGMRKEELPLDDWLKELAPSDELRTWFGHDPQKWDEFCRRYHSELDAKQAAVRQLLSAARRGNVTLLFSAHDVEHNNAIALREYLREARSGRKQQVRSHAHAHRAH